MPQVGDTRPLKDGGVAIFDGSTWRRPAGRSQQTAPVGSIQRAFNGGLGKLDAEATANLREMSGGAAGRIAETETLLNNLPNTPTGMGSGIGNWLATNQNLAGKFGVPSQMQSARAGQLDALSSGNVLRDAAAIKPISNSDIMFLQSLQAGSAQGRESNRRRLVAQQWFDAKLMGQNAAREKWIQTYGAPSNPGRGGKSFDAWWQEYGNANYPRPIFEGPGAHQGFSGYRPPRRRPNNGGPKNYGGATVLSVEPD